MSYLFQLIFHPEATVGPRRSAPAVLTMMSVPPTDPLKQALPAVVTLTVLALWLRRDTSRAAHAHCDRPGRNIQRAAPGPSVCHSEVGEWESTSAPHKHTCVCKHSTARKIKENRKQEQIDYMVRSKESCSKVLSSQTHKHRGLALGPMRGARACARK